MGNQTDGAIEYTQENSDHRRAWREQSYEGLWVDTCNSSLTRSPSRHDCPLPHLPHILWPPRAPLTLPTAIPSSLEKILSTCPLARHRRLHRPRGPSIEGVGLILRSFRLGGSRETSVPESAWKLGGRDCAGAGRLKAGHLEVSPRCGHHRPSVDHSATIKWVWRGWSFSLRRGGGGYEEVAFTPPHARRRIFIWTGRSWLM